VCGGYTRYVVCQYCGTTDPSAVAAGLMSLTPLVQRTPEEAEAHARSVSPAPMAANPVGSHAASLQELRSFADPAYDTAAADQEPVAATALAPAALAPAGVAPAFAAADASPFRVPAQVGSVAPPADWSAEPVYAGRARPSAVPAAVCAGSGGVNSGGVVGSAGHGTSAPGTAARR